MADMSVINDMLRDLDHRHGAQPVAPFGGIAVVAAQREWPWRIVLIGLIVSALIVGAYTLVSSRLDKSALTLALSRGERGLDSAAQKNLAVNLSAAELPAAPLEKLVSVEKVAALEKVAPADKIVSAEKLVPSEKAVPAEKLAPSEKAVSIEKVVSVEKAASMEKIAPAEKSPAIEIATVAPTAPAVKPQLLKQPSQTPDAIAEESYRLAMEALRHNARGDAERELNNSLSLSPNHLAAIAALARLYLEDARFDAALQLLSPALAANTEALELRQLLARAQLSLGRASEAQQLLAARQPELSVHTDYYAMLAALEQQLGRYAAAAQHYGELLNVDTSIAPWWLGLALALDNQQQNADAAAAYRRALALNNLPIAARTFAQQRLSALEGRS